ncbi:UDP-N-acetylmuramate dehydrogenase [Candidatus Aminicenantes bacterium AC-335-A11]|jgi:UDP-N-acetylmuramate dehydrogenase|nr:UDP-N-acetylmuramate dehydrogenase [SCandidatus Aminicenantes bacterium Aminicenantia_JdfR_composite]MCP2597417.1 UDP-N-acetylmuramate dehydrogenase [Candidatus Aminicenantes bacterium AC-335-G13]MCP2606643.1 UDP-N-acetylmuramate dehydrogenase [Candidatus Aminicenantes bacterium AC-708-I09]MCP2618888.1 UDP-N-acetylmuramate dehydrogenase [Candidatus Aminicenantes bacterium AC-335-A11]
MTTENFLIEFEKELQEIPKLKVSLKQHCRFRIGGPADFFFKVKNPDKLKKVIALVNKYKIPFLVIGEGTNLLFDDEGFRGLIIKNEIKGIKVNPKKGLIEAYSGTPLKEIIKEALENSLGGLEALTGIPGTFGGAISGNAGAYGRSISDFFEKGIIIDEKGNEREVDKEYFQFDYRWSRIKKTKEVILSGTLKLEKMSQPQILERMEEIYIDRQKKHPPPEIACAGSYFKNIKLPDGNFIPVGYLLDKVNAKSIKVGDARVYEKHANILINKGNASSKDILTLASILKQKVKDVFGIDLTEEVIYVKANPLNE